MNFKNTILLVTLVVSCFLIGCEKKKTAIASQDSVFFIEPKDGASVTSPFTVKFGLTGMTIKPAGQDMMDTRSGHHHILIDNPAGFTPKGEVVAADATNIHYGKGQTETSLTLPVGKHTLTLQFADGAHRSYGKEMAATITVYVTAAQ